MQSLPVVAKDALLASNGRGAYAASAPAANISHIPVIASRLEDWLRKDVASWYLAPRVDRLGENFTPERALPSGRATLQIDMKRELGLMFALGLFAIPVFLAGGLMYFKGLERALADVG